MEDKQLKSQSRDALMAEIAAVLEKHIYPDSQGSYILQHQMGSILEKIEQVIPRDRVSMVHEFHTVFGHPVNNKLVFDKAQAVKRYNYLYEELKEMWTAIEEEDLVALADVYMDIEYFNNGGLVETGLHTIHQQLFEEVHRSNMTKLCKNMQEAKETKAYHEKLEGECYIDDTDGGLYTVRRKSDNKTMKSINYEEPDLAKIISHANFKESQKGKAV